jgi:regulator of nucleoside diphosphate kinase
VTLNNWVAFRLSGDDKAERRLLVVPSEVFDLQVHLSVLSPLGAALVGVEVGSPISYVDLEGEPRLAILEAVGPDDLFRRKGLEVALCIVALLAVWIALARYFWP